MDGTGSKIFISSSSNPEGKHEEIKTTDHQANLTELFQAQVLNEGYSLDSPLQKMEEKIELPTGRFFCTHTVKKKDLERNIPILSSHKIVESRLESVIEQKVQQKFGKKYLQKCSELTIPLEGEEIQSILQNQECKKSCEAFAKNKNNIETFKKIISISEKTITKLSRATYSDIVKECQCLKSIENAQEKIALLTEKYIALLPRIHALKNFTIKEGIEVTDSQKQEVNNIQEEIKNLTAIIKELNFCYGSLNSSEFLKKSPLSSIQLAQALNKLNASVAQFKKDNDSTQISYKNTAQQGLFNCAHKVSKQLLILKEQLEQVKEHKLRLEEEAQRVIPPYMVTADLIRPQWELMKQCKRLEKSTVAQEKTILLEKKYNILKANIDLLIDQKTNPKETISSIKKDIEEIKNMIKDLNPICKDLQVNNFLTTLPMSFNKKIFEEMEEKLGELSIEEMPQQLEILYIKASEELKNLKTSLITVDQFKQQLESETNKNTIVDLQVRFLKEINSMLTLFSEEESNSIKPYLEALSTLKEQREFTLKMMKELTSQFAQELQQGNENESFNPKTVNQLIGQMEFLYSLFNQQITKDSTPLVRASTFMEKLEQLKKLDKKSARNEIINFEGGILNNLHRLLNVQNQKIDGQIKKLENGILKEKEEAQSQLIKTQNELEIAKAEKKQIIQTFLMQIHQQSGVDFNQFSKSLQEEIREAQQLIKELLIEYRIHSFDRFSNLFTAHRNFVIRLNYLLGKMHPDVAKQIKINLKDFLKIHSNTDFRSKSNKQILLYRDLQGRHTDDLQLQECERIQTIVAKRFQLIFGKKIALKEFGGTTAMQAAHVAPFSGLFSWQNDVLIQALFKSSLVPTRGSSKTIIKEDIQEFAPLIQENGTADPTQIQKELDSRIKTDISKTEELNVEDQQFILEALLFLSRISSLEMSETEHFPNWFNQTMDSLSEEEITKSKLTQTNYKVLLGDALIELIDRSHLSEKTPLVLTKSHIDYLSKTLLLLGAKMKQLVEKEQELTVMELLECHALISICGGIQNLKVDELGERMEAIGASLFNLERKIRSSTLLT